MTAILGHNAGDSAYDVGRRSGVTALVSVLRIPTKLSSYCGVGDRAVVSQFSVLPFNCFDTFSIGSKFCSFQRFVASWFSKVTIQPDRFTGGPVFFDPAALWGIAASAVSEMTERLRHRNWWASHAVTGRGSLDL